MEVTDIIFIAIAAIAVIGKIIGSIDKQEPIIEDIKEDTLSKDLTQEDVKQPSTITPKAEVKHSTPTQKATNKAKTAPKIEEEDEFDLKKAVVYSEILTPKFKDDNF